MKPSEFLSKRDSWCQGTMARDKDGYSCDVFNESAVRWCMLGAMKVCLPYKTLMDKITVLEEMLHQPIPEWNDSRIRTRDQVVAMLIKVGL